MIYDRKTVRGSDVMEGLWQAGLEDMEPRDFGELYADLLSDDYWNDPKCLHRRIQMVGGDSLRYFDYFKELGYEFIP